MAGAASHARTQRRSDTHTQQRRVPPRKRPRPPPPRLGPASRARSSPVTAPSCGGPLQQRRGASGANVPSGNGVAEPPSGRPPSVTECLRWQHPLRRRSASSGSTLSYVSHRWCSSHAGDLLGRWNRVRWPR
ncbi:hypothetical protein SORBI_3009G155250 [Sorghum bicolor]|uniref:Uncharacterized protein n=1 Tax=Sorghum bicolor TaxID=4558 RepID=A0A1Z5R3T4_SORBI|nr:hypothetical protein SORBI_3009G155250 [Sorghum bicolor]